MTLKLAVASAALFSTLASAQNNRLFDARNPSFDDVVDHAIFQEDTLLKILRGEQPIVETYIQNMQPDSDFGVIPKNDQYFLGKLDLSRGVNTASFVSKSGAKSRALDSFTNLFSARYLPRGFAQMILIDGGEFNRAHYDFEYVRREFLGDVRTWVINVSPKKQAGSGRFIGKIWVEDRDFNVVRFNGTYSAQRFGQLYLHFDSWRVNCGPDLWMPFAVYSEETSKPYALGLRAMNFKAMTQIWGYTTPADRREGEFTSLTVDMPSVQDKSDQAADNSPVESLRAWERESENNVLDRMEKANILAVGGDVEKVLETVINNLVVTNNLQMAPEIRARVLLTTPLESFTLGHTIVISRGLIDTLPDEASLAAILSHELAHIALGHQIDTRFAFSDRVLFDDEATLDNFRFVRPQAQEDAANAKALTLLENSPYKDKVSQAGIFLNALGAEAGQLPSLVKPLLGNRMTEGNNVVRLAALLQNAPRFAQTRTDQVAAFPLGARTSLDPWTNKLRMTRIRVVPLISARERMPFELTPIFLHLRYQSKLPADAPDQPATASAGDPITASKP
jgi:hypothetical protein